jgi:hypothetical protein
MAALGGRGASVSLGPVDFVEIGAMARNDRSPLTYLPRETMAPDSLSRFCERVETTSRITALAESLGPKFANTDLDRFET